MLAIKTIEEDQFFNRLLHDSNGKIHAEEFATDSVKHFDGNNIFPKLLFHISQKYRK